MAVLQNNMSPVMIEPLRKNRFIIKLKGVGIPMYLFLKYKIFNEGDDFIFTTSFYETFEYVFNPKDFFNITGVQIEYLDPTGAVINGLTFDVKGSNYKIKQRYSSKKGGLQINKLRFIIDKDSMNLLYSDNK